jgi:hypothetical protein
MIVLGIIYILLQAFDIITTNLALKKGCEEGNPLLKKSLNGRAGFPKYLIFIKIGIGIYLTYLMYFVETMFSISFLNYLVLGLDIFMFIVVLNNSIRIPIQIRINREYFNEIGNLKKFKQVQSVREWKGLLLSA